MAFGTTYAWYRNHSAVATHNSNVPEYSVALAPTSVLGRFLPISGREYCCLDLERAEQQLTPKAAVPCAGYQRQQRPSNEALAT